MAPCEWHMLRKSARLESDAHEAEAQHASAMSAQERHSSTAFTARVQFFFLPSRGRG